MKRPCRPAALAIITAIILSLAAGGPLPGGAFVYAGESPETESAGVFAPPEEDAGTPISAEDETGDEGDAVPGPEETYLMDSAAMAPAGDSEPGAPGQVEAVALADDDKIVYIDKDDEDALAAIGDDADALDSKYIMTGDIGLSDDWDPIGNPEEPFTGIFDGASHTISGLKIEGGDSAGLFSFAGEGAIIRNLTVEVVSVTGGTGVGALCGRSSGAVFENCFVIEKDRDSFVSGEYQAGGLVGAAINNSMFTNCGSAVDVDAESGEAGGLIGSIAGKSSASRSVVDRCYSSGNAGQTGDDAAIRGAGGLIGYARFTDIKNSYASGAVASVSYSSGGLVGGVEYTSIEKCLASGNVRTYMGGSGGITYSAGSTSRIKDCAAANKYLAVFDTSSRSGRITTATAAASLSGNIHYGSMVYTPGGDTTGGGEAKTINALRADSTYKALGWDFGTVWEWDSVNRCPRLNTGGPPQGDTLGLDEQAPRIISEQPVQTYLYASEKLVLSVAASGTGLSYRWFRNGVPLENSNGPSGDEEEAVSGADSKNLTIDNIELSPSSAYVAEVRDSAGRDVVSARTIVNVMQGASEPKVTNPKDQAAFEGQKAVFSITAQNKENEILSFQWERTATPDTDESWEAIPRARGDAYATQTLSLADSGIWYRCIVTNTLNATSKTKTTAPAQLLVKKAIKSIRISKTRLLMKTGDTEALEAICLPSDAEQDGSILWGISSGGSAASVDIDTGTVRAWAPGTACVVASARGNSDIFALCFIEVADEPGASSPPEADTAPKLPAGPITVNSKSEEGSPVAMLPTDSFTFDAVRIAGAKPAPPEGAFGVKAASAPLWYISAKGVPNGKYTLELQAEKDGSEAGSVFKITINVTDKIPAANVKLPKLNTFYKDAAGVVVITGKGLPGIERVVLSKSGKEADGDVTQNFGVYGYDGSFILYSFERFGSLVKGKPAAAGFLEIWYKGYSEPYKVKITVPAKPAPPKAKFAKAKLSIDPANGLTTDFRFTGADIQSAAPNNAEAFKKSFDGYGYEHGGISLTLANDVLYKDDGKLKAGAAGKTYSAKMDIWLKDARGPLTLKASVKALKPGTKAGFSLSKGSVTLNKRFEGQKADIAIRCSQANADFYVREVVCNKYLEVIDFGDYISVVADPRCPKKTHSCKAVISCGGKKTVLPFTVKVINTGLKVGLSGKKGKIDLNDRENTSASYKPVLKNYKGDAIDVWIDDEYGDEDLSKLFSVNLTDAGRVEFHANTDLSYDDEFVFGRTYKLKLGFRLEAVQADGDGTPFYETTDNTYVSIKPVRSKVKHSLSKPLKIYRSRTSYMEVFDLAPVSPAGARIDVDRFNLEAPAANKAFFLYLDDGQKLHIMLKDSNAVKTGKAKLVFPVVYEGQGLDKKNGDYMYKPNSVAVDLEILK